MTFEKDVTFHPAWDKRSPSPSKNHGIHGVELRFVLKGSDGAVQFVVYTNWHLPEVQKEIDAKAPNPSFPYLFHEPMPADLGYHSRVPRYEGQQLVGDACEYLGGAPCYYDGSGLNAHRVMDVLRREGSDAVWRELEAYYWSVFAEGAEAREG